ncbi:histidine kinase [Microbacterium deminutum]|uniref:histidine kinase n=1 Tax=Microbacterium deminutum TaxID=344164 RepID=A0ABP5CG45_9MICO
MLIARRNGLDLLIVLLTAAAMIEVLVKPTASDAPQEMRWLRVAAIGLIVLPLFARRRFPFGALIAYWLLAVGVSFIDGQLIPLTTGLFILAMAVAFLLGSLPNLPQAQLGLAVVVGGVAIVVYNLTTHTASQLVFIPLLFGVCWFLGFAVRQRGDQVAAAEDRASRAERDRQASARIAVAEERARIARELHDIVAHAVSVMVLQTGAVRHRLGDDFADEKEALRGVEETGRRALSEMRHLLGALRRDDEAAALSPQPGMAGLDGLLNQVREAGLPVRLEVHGEPIPLPDPIDLAVYRIAQEGLTNVLKHAHASRADVSIRYAPWDLRVEIRDDGDGPQPGDGLGHGIVGMRERVKIYGGELAAGPGPEGGFVLSARLPLDR